MLFRYLYKSTQEGVIGYLVNKLYNEPVENIDYYLPQLWYSPFLIPFSYLIVTKKEGVQCIEKFVLEVAIKYPNIGLKALQLFQSYSEDFKAEYQEAAMNFFDILGATLVNGDIPLKYKSSKQKEIKSNFNCVTGNRLRGIRRQKTQSRLPIHPSQTHRETQVPLHRPQELPPQRPQPHPSQETRCHQPLDRRRRPQTHPHHPVFI